MIIGDRILARLEALGMSQGKLARSVGLSRQAISKMILGGIGETGKLYLIARALETTPEYLIGETDDPSPGSPAASPTQPYSPPPAEIAEGKAPSDVVQVREIDLTFGMGATYLDVPVTTQSRVFSREWLRQYTHANPDRLYFAQGIGDSMFPTLLDSDLLLIDTSQDTLKLNDKIWAIAYGNTGAVKRLRSMPDGGVKILSDNPSIPDETAYDGELTVLGRVVAVVRKM